jgi:hypothetical protein
MIASAVPVMGILGVELRAFLAHRFGAGEIPLPERKVKANRRFPLKLP